MEPLKPLNLVFLFICWQVELLVGWTPALNLREKITSGGGIELMETNHLVPFAGLKSEDSFKTSEHIFSLFLTFYVSQRILKVKSFFELRSM